MSQYITKEEIATYCNNIPGVTESDVIIASNFIDGYCNRTFGVNEAKETIKINKKCRGRLLNTPIIEIKSVKELVITPLGQNITDEEISSLDLDIEGDGYFTYLAPYNIFDVNYCGCYTYGRKRVIQVEYTYGYANAPEDIKIVTAMLAQNIRQFNTFSGFKKLSTLDYTIEMGNASFFTEDMRNMLDKYKV